MQQAVRKPALVGRRRAGLRLTRDDRGEPQLSAKDGVQKTADAPGEWREQWPPCWSGTMGGVNGGLQRFLGLRRGDSTYGGGNNRSQSANAPHHAVPATRPPP